MAGGNPPNPPHSASSAQSDHRKSRLGSASAMAAAAVDHKLSGAPNSTIIHPNSKDHNNKPPPTKPNRRPENPSPRPDNTNSVPGSSQGFPFNDPPPLPSYGFHMLDRRCIVLADGSARSYFALPPNYENFSQIPRPGLQLGFLGRDDFRLERPEFLGPDVRARNIEHLSMGPENLLKRKFGEDDRVGMDDGFERQRQQLLQYGNSNEPGPSVLYNLGRGEEMRPPKNTRYSEGSSSKLKHSEVDQNALKRTFLHFVKLVFETANQKKNYLANGKQGPLPCLACGRSSKDFPDMHSLIVHAYNSDSANSLVDHLAFHKALCILMGWNCLMPPNNSKAYQNLSAGDAEAALDDLIVWPPAVLIHNTITGRGKDGRMEGLGNKAMDRILRDLGFMSGKSMSMYAREGHLGIHTVKFSGDELGLKEAMRLADYFEREKHGRKDWARVQCTALGRDDDEKNPDIVRLDPRTGEKKRVFYGYLATVDDLDKITFEIRKKVSIVSAREFNK